MFSFIATDAFDLSSFHEMLLNWFISFCYLLDVVRWNDFISQWNWFSSSLSKSIKFYNLTWFTCNVISRLGKGIFNLAENETRERSKMERWRWRFCGLINFLQLCTAVTFMVLQFIVSYCCDDERRDEKSFPVLRSVQQKGKKKKFSFQQMTLPFFIYSVVIFVLFSSAFPPHSFITSDLVPWQNSENK